jgi:glycosyltransferase involved in cell wall biosynthesis
MSLTTKPFPHEDPNIAAIIPAYNESKGIEAVLDVICRTDFISEIIVVDDGSQDATVEKVLNVMRHEVRIRLIQHPHNLGKGQAILNGRDATFSPILLLLDADLIGLTPDHLCSLVEPVVQNKADMTCGLFRNGHITTDLAHWAAPFLSGQRCLRSEILERMDLRASSGYGFETALTVAARRSGYRTLNVYLYGVWHPPSEFHRGILHGVWTRVRMYAQIVRTLFLVMILPVNIRKKMEDPKDT